MAKNKYYTLYTDKGRKRINELLAEGKELTFTHIAVGDGGGFVYEPEAGQEALRNEVYRGSINAKLVDPDDTNQIIFQLVIPVSAGGFYIREAGLFDDSGLMIAIAKTSESYKPNVSDGSGKEIILSFIIALSNAEDVTIKIPDSVTFATQEYVLQQIEKGIGEHCREEDPHEQYLKESEYNEKIAEIEGVVGEKAAANHNHDNTYLKKTDATNTYATKEALSNGLAGKAATSHTHSNYAASGHNHDSVYSKTNHTHSGYAASSHNHDSVYMKKSSAAPMPTNAAGVGQVFATYNTDSSEYGSPITIQIPSGGTWLVWQVSANRGLKGGIFSGGSKFTSSIGDNGLVAYRIA